jgi:hypothetical protein
MNNRQPLGQETAQRLLNWQSQSIASQRMAYGMLTQEGYSIDPSNVQGPDGAKDAIAIRNGKRYVVAVYFCTGQKTVTEIYKKFKGDLSGVTKNNAVGFIFFTNQFVGESDKKKMLLLCDGFEFELYHLERISSLLDTPINYGRRLEFLSIEMAKEEQLAFYAAMIEYQTDRFDALNSEIGKVLNKLQSTANSMADYSTGGLTWCIGAVMSRESYERGLIIAVQAYGEHKISSIGVNVFIEQKRIGGVLFSDVVPGTIRWSSMLKLADHVFEIGDSIIRLEMTSPCFNSSSILNIHCDEDGIISTRTKSTAIYIYKAHHSQKIRTVEAKISYDKNMHELGAIIIRNELTFE